MPCYTYLCEVCEAESEVFHLMSETCDSCQDVINFGGKGKPGCKGVVSRLIPKISEKIKREYKVGQIVDREIKDIKERIKESNKEFQELKET